jgi:hypothetical protein
LLSIQLPKCLRDEITIVRPIDSLNDDGTPKTVTLTVTIPATSPTALPIGWYEVGRTADYWKMGVWVTEVVEVKLPHI